MSIFRYIVNVLGTRLAFNDGDYVVGSPLIWAIREGLTKPTKVIKIEPGSKDAGGYFVSLEGKKQKYYYNFLKKA